MNPPVTKEFADCRPIYISGLAPRTSATFITTLAGQCLSMSSPGLVVWLVSLVTEECTSFSSPPVFIDRVLATGMFEGAYLSRLLIFFSTVQCAKDKNPTSLQGRHNERDGVLNRWCLDYLLHRLLRCRSKKTSKLRVTGLCEGNPPVTCRFPSQRNSNAENVSICWRHHVTLIFFDICVTRLNVMAPMASSSTWVTRQMAWRCWCMMITLIELQMALGYCQRCHGRKSNIWTPLPRMPTSEFTILHAKVMTWKRCPYYWPFVRRIHRSRSPVDFPTKDQW